MKRLLFITLLALLSLLVFVPLALADAPQPALALSGDQTWIVLAGALVPLATYLVNHYAPWTSEHVKAIVQVIVAALTGALGKLISTGNLDFGHAATWQYMGTAILAALVAHNLLYVPGGINVLLKAGTNRR